MKKKGLLPLLLLSLLLTGCGYRTVEEMYRIPKRTEEYKMLQSTIDQAMVGLEFAPPTAGENQQTVQMADLTGDGVPEYLVFAKGNSDKPLQILIFQETSDGAYSLMETIQMNGAAFEQVEYTDIDGLPGSEIIVGRRLSNQMMRIAAVFSFADGQSSQLINTLYGKFFSCEMIPGAGSELVVIRDGEAEASNATVVIYTFRDSVLERSKEIQLSGRLDRIRRIKTSRLQSGETAIYIASSVNDSAIITDILALKDGSLSNLSAFSESGNSVQLLRNYYLYLEDIDEDGVMELPSLLDMKAASTDSQIRQHMICWYAKDIDGREYKKMYTFHNLDGGWYLRLDNSWAERFTVEQNGGNYTFYMWSADYSVAQPLFTIFALTGKDMNQEANANNRFVLYRGENIIYSAKLEIGSAMYGFDEEYLKNSFRMIHTDWKTEGA